MSWRFALRFSISLALGLVVDPVPLIIAGPVTMLAAKFIHDEATSTFFWDLGRDILLTGATAGLINPASASLASTIMKNIASAAGRIAIQNAETILSMLLSLCEKGISFL
ncbi:hypothetical protein EDD21DRAFT_377310 [Dissophora ornata]|nr:hypothetical protein EDD21DRAFT_377310 [Dissophora ornata]